MRRTLLLVSITWGALAGPLRAQTGSDTTWIGRWRDSLAGLDEGELRARLSASPSPRTVEERLRLGWLLEAGGERFDSAALLTRAADQFYEVTVRQKRWTAGWFGMGTAKAALADLGVREVRSAHQLAGTGWVWGSALAYLEALKVDPSYSPAAIALARLSPRLDNPSRARAAAVAISRALVADSTDPSLWLIDARASRMQDDHENALASLDRALTLPEAPRGGLQLERARELYALGRDREADSAYYDGAANDDSLARALYRQDLAYIADSAELRSFAGLAPEARAGWLRGFWGRRERASGRPAGTRLAEHNRRRRYALAHFSVIPTWARQFDHQMINRDTLSDLDDRGAIYMRHGEPDQTASIVGGGDPPLLSNESWLYFRPEGNLIFHFIGALRSGWHLTTSLDDIGHSPDGPSAEVYASRMSLDPGYGLLSLRIWQDSITRATLRATPGVDPTFIDNVDRRPVFAVEIARERRERTAEIRRGMATDSDPLRFAREMEPIVQVFGASAEAIGQGRLVVAFSLPANDRLVPIPLPDGGTGYLLRLRVTSADDSGRTTLDSDSLLRVRTPHPLARGEHLSVVRSYLLPATGDQRVRLILTDTARAFGAVRVVNGVPLPPTDVPRPVMTDLIVGAARSGVAWSRPGGSPVPLHPLNAWTTDEAVEINFELSGLAGGAPYNVRLGISAIGDDSTTPPKASVEFANQASGGREFVSQSLVLRTLRPGRYLLTATVTIGDTVLRREKRITVVQAR